MFFICSDSRSKESNFWTPGLYQFIDGNPVCRSLTTLVLSLDPSDRDLDTRIGNIHDVRFTILNMSLLIVFVDLIIPRVSEYHLRLNFLGLSLFCPS